MLANEIELYEKQYDKKGIQIIGRKACDIKDLITNLKVWHEELTRIILMPNNLYYYATNNFDSDYYIEELTKENMECVQIALKVLIKEPEQFYEFYEKKSEFSKRVVKATTVEEIEDIVEESGVKKVKIKGIDLKTLKTNVQRKLCMDFCFGIFGEMLFYNVAENLLYNKLVISKVQLVTAPNTNAHGSDGVFCDEEKKILYFGESKFTTNLQQGISQALSSMSQCLDRINLDKNFMIIHRKDLKNGYGKKIDQHNISEYTCKILIFLLHGEDVDYSKIVKQIENYRNDFQKKLKGLEFIVVSFPIYDKECLKESIAQGVENYGQ